MPETIVVLFDNGMSSQNQDYLPSRFMVQKEAIESLVFRKFEGQHENTLGLVPLAQGRLNEIITPTKQKPHIQTFLNGVELNRNTDVMKCLFQCINIFSQREPAGFVLVVLLCTEVPEAVKDELFAKIYEILSLGITVRMVFFGEAVDMADAFRNIEFTNFSCMEVRPNEDFTDCVLPFISSSETMEEDDPELAEAIRLSLEEQKKSQQ